MKTIPPTFMVDKRSVGIEVINKLSDNKLKERETPRTSEGTKEPSSEYLNFL